MIIPAYSELSHLENYVRVVAIEFELQRVSSYNVTNFLYHNINGKLLSLYIYKKVLFKFQNFVIIITSYCQFYICYNAQIYAK